MTVVEELDSLPERIKVSSGRITELREQLAAELETRERLIVQAVDEANIPQADVARSAGVSQPHIIRILAKASSD